MFSGTLTAMISPFTDDALDVERLREQTEYQIAQGVTGLVPCGTTGESPTLSHEEHEKVVEVVIETAAGRVPVVAGAGSNSTREALQLTKHAKDAGAAASLQVNPYYNKPTQAGLYRHFMTIADQVDLPMVLYNIPGRSSVALDVDTIVQLAKHPNIVVIKEATGSMDVASEIACTTDLTILSGDDSLTLPLMAIGAKGVISVASNLIADRVAAMTQAALNGQWDEARTQHMELWPIFRAMFLQTNPIPIKTAMAMAGRDTGELRLPMCAMDDAKRSILRELLAQQKIIDA